MGGHRLRFGENMARRTPKSEKTGFRLAKKAKVAASPKILQLELWREMFSTKYGLNGAIKPI